MTHTRTRRTRPVPVAGLVMLVVAGLAACGGSPTTSAPDAPTAPFGTGTATTEPDSTDGAVVREADSEHGRILVDGRGHTLYGFTRDTEGTSTCTGGCLDAWPPLVVEDGTLPAGLDDWVFEVVPGPGDRPQLKAGQWPLYTYANDLAPGDTNGQGSGGVWFVVDPTGELIRPAPTTTMEPPAGP